MQETKVVLSRAIRAAAQNNVKLEKKAASVAESLTVPSNVIFAKFEHGGRIYALSARVIVEVDEMTNRVPDVIIRAGRKPIA